MAFTFMARSTFLLYIFSQNNWDHTYLQSSKPVIFTYNTVQTFPYEFILQHNFSGCIVSHHMNMLLCTYWISQVENSDFQFFNIINNAMENFNHISLFSSYKFLELEFLAKGYIHFKVFGFMGSNCIPEKL